MLFLIMVKVGNFLVKVIDLMVIMAIIVMMIRVITLIAR